MPFFSPFSGDVGLQCIERLGSAVTVHTDGDHVPAGQIPQIAGGAVRRALLGQHDAVFAEADGGAVLHDAHRYQTPLAAGCPDTRTVVIATIPVQPADVGGFHQLGIGQRRHRAGLGIAIPDFAHRHPATGHIRLQHDGSAHHSENAHPLPDVGCQQIRVAFNGLGSAQVLTGGDGLACRARPEAGRAFAGNAAGNLPAFGVAHCPGQHLLRGYGAIGGKGAVHGFAVGGDGNPGLDVFGGQLGRFGRGQAPAVKS